MPRPKAKKFSPAEVEERRHAFNEIDADGSGALDTKELGAFFRKCGEGGDDEASVITYLYGEKHTGKITFAEFLKFTADADEQEKDPYFIQRKVFQKIDTDKSGRLEANELVQLAHKLGEKLTLAEARAAIKEVKGGASGGLTFAEALEAFPVLA
jgi:Ca2+-binding EF-hand superfamily protein